MKYFIYLVECSDGTYYCGYTNDLEKRVSKHNTGVYGAKYTKSRRPVVLVYSEEFDLKNQAMARERELKKLSRKEKIELISVTNYEFK